MKKLFPGYFKEKEDELKPIWESSLFVFDANILLNLYRYSDATRQEFFRILTKIQDRVWLPHRAAEEYLINRLSVIEKQEKSYDETTNAINNLKKDLENSRQHPFILEQSLTEVKKVFEKLCNELKENKNVHSKRIYDDEIKNHIANIFEDKVGSPYSETKLEEIFSAGEERYERKIPPGYKDASKSDGNNNFEDKCRSYGDLIVWNQIIDTAIEKDVGIILITDDRKEDWWERFKGKTIGPRPELIKEFRDRVGKPFQMHQADSFLELARRTLDENVSEAAVEEVREIRNDELISYYESINVGEVDPDNYLKSLLSELESYEKEINEEEKRNYRIKASRSDQPSLFDNPNSSTLKNDPKTLEIIRAISDISASDIRLSSLKAIYRTIEHKINERTKSID